MSSYEQVPLLEFKSGGFHLFIPPTPLAYPPTPRPGRFIMVDDLEQVFFDVDYETSAFKNRTDWQNLDLHHVPDPAIVFPPVQYYYLRKSKFATGMLVSIESRNQPAYLAKRLGAVNVRLMNDETMNWAMFRSWKGEELPTEIQNGLLRQVWSRRAQTEASNIEYVHQASILDHMPRPWHDAGEYLSYELDGIFAGCSPIPFEQPWKIRVEEGGKVN